MDELRHISARTVGDAWYCLLWRLYHHPERTIAPRGLPTREITAVTLRVEDLRQNLLVHPARGLNYRFAVAEWLWMAFGQDDVQTLLRYNKQMARFSDDGVRLYGAYGPRLMAQWEYVKGALRADPTTRQAVSSIWTPVPKASKDVPCTLELQWLLREERLHLVVTMRSSDVWLGVPYDFFSFSQLTNLLAGELGVKTGSLTMQLGSSHLYEANLADAKLVLVDDEPLRTVGSPALPGWPKRLDFQTLKETLAMGQFKGHLITEPWATYASVLSSATSAVALKALEKGEAHDH